MKVAMMTFLRTTRSEQLKNNLLLTEIDMYLGGIDTNLEKNIF